MTLRLNIITYLLQTPYSTGKRGQNCFENTINQ